MNENVIFQNHKKIISELLKLKSALSEYPGTSVSELIYEMPEKFDVLFKEIFKNKYVEQHYDPDVIVLLLSMAIHNCEAEPESNLYDNFVQSFQYVYTDWMAIFPLGERRLFSKSLIKEISFGDHRLHGELENYKKFKKYFGKKGVLIDDYLLDHQAQQTDNVFLKNKLLILDLHGTEHVLKFRALRHAETFKELFDVYAAHFEMVLFPSKNVISHYFLLNKKNGKIARFPLRKPLNFTALDQTTINRLKSNGFVKNLSKLTELKNVDALCKRLSNAVHFFSKGYNDEDILSKFLFYVISAESLFSRDKYTPLRSTLADSIAIISPKHFDKISLHKKVLEIYDLRSSIVHTAARHVDYELVQETEKIIAMIIIEYFKLYFKYGTTEKPEKAFFDNLLRLKIT